MRNTDRSVTAAPQPAPWRAHPQVSRPRARHMPVAPRPRRLTLGPVAVRLSSLESGLVSYGTSRRPRVHCPRGFASAVSHSRCRSALMRAPPRSPLSVASRHGRVRGGTATADGARRRARGAVRPRLGAGLGPRLPAIYVARVGGLAPGLRSARRGASPVWSGRASRPAVVRVVRAERAQPPCAVRCGSRVWALPLSAAAVGSVVPVCGS